MNPLDPRARFDVLRQSLENIGPTAPVLAPILHLLADIDRIRYAGAPSSPADGPLLAWSDDRNVYIEGDLAGLNGVSSWDVDLCIRDGKVFIRMGLG